MINVGERFPEFNCNAVISSDINTAFTSITPIEYEGMWKVFFFWPKNFTFICPTELAGFAALYNQFQKRDTQVFGVSIDSTSAHLAWRQQNKQLTDIPFPMLSDIKRELSMELGILDPIEGVSQRATFIVDPGDTVRFVMVTDLNVGRNPEEVLRVLDALQTDELCPCSWEPGKNIHTYS